MTETGRKAAGDPGFDAGVGYSKLHSLLGEKSWSEADRQAQKVFYRLARREQEGYVRDEDIARIPIQDLRKFDRLWQQHSKGRFGISVQQRLFLQLGQTQESEFQLWSPFTASFMGYRQGSRWKELNENHWNKFLSRIGWLSDGHYLTEQERVEKLCTTPLEHLPKGFLPYHIYRNSLDPLASSNPFEFVRVGFIGASAVLTGNASVNTIGRAFFLFTHRELALGDGLDYENQPEPAQDLTQSPRQGSGNNYTFIQQHIHQNGAHNINIGTGDNVPIDIHAPAESNDSPDNR